MSASTTPISGGSVISATGVVPMGVLVDGETIVALYAPGTAAAQRVNADRTIDATGKYVVLGGIDVHTHMEPPFGGTFAPTRSRRHAPLRRVASTTIIDFAVQTYGGNVTEALARGTRKADGNCAIDYGFHQIIGGVDDDALKAMDYLVENEGVTSFKLFMAYPGVFYSDDGQILRAMQRASENGAVIMMHAENGIAIDVLAAQALARGETDPKYHGIVRRSELEGEATNRAIVLSKVAGNVPVHRAHVGQRGARGPRHGPPHRRQRVRRDLSPVPLHVARGPPRRPGFEGAKYVCSPPIRTKHAHHHQDLWKGLRTNELVCVSTDHCPFCFKEQKELGLGDFTKIPNGIGGVEHRMDLIYQGVVNGELSSHGGSRRVPPRRRACSGCTRRRASSPRARTRTS